jgi:galactonate dehydratase
MDIMVDLHGRTSAAMAIQYAEVLKPFRPFFIEEPCQPEDWEGTARVSRSTTVPIAAGERLVHRREFLPLLQAEGIAVAQPDVCHAGGLTEVKRIAALCDTFGVSMAPHNPLGPIATMVNIHLGFATPNFLIQEVMRADVPWRDEIISGVTPIIDGYVAPSQAPGIGIEINFEAAEKHPFQEVRPIQWYQHDGSVADW